jgi:predicted metal-dependent hydrolase
MPASEPDSACSRALPPRGRDGIALFNRGEFFEAHEALEDIWRDERREIRDLYRGILQIAVTFFHITRGNFAGAVKVYRRSQKWLKKFPDVCQGVNVKQLLIDAKNAMDALQALGEENIASFDRSLFKPILLTKPTGKRVYICDRCGHEMVERNCKIICPNCGNRFDCSDLNIYFD